MRWEELFGTIDVSARGVQGTAPVAAAAPQPVVQTVPQPVARPLVPTPEVASTTVVPAPAAAGAASPAPEAASYPSAWTMVQTFSTAAVQFAASGGQTVSREVREQRLSICQMCPDYDGTRCVRCGCFIAAKTWVPQQTCPIGKWPT
jgi:hypothetical protein